MLTIIRKNQKGLMFIVAVLTIIAFAFLYNPTDPAELAGNAAARIYGKTLTQSDIDRQVRIYQLALALGQLDLIEGLGGMAANEDQAVSEFVWNLLVLRHEARQMGIEPTDEQVAGAIREISIFATDGRFDPVKYQEFVASQLGPRGLTPFSLEEVVRDSLRLTSLQEIISSPAAVGSDEVARALRFFQPADLKIIRFDLGPILDSVEVSEEDARAFYEQNKTQFVAPEKISVEVAKFSLSGGASALEGRARVAALQEVAAQASDFAESALAEQFATKASEAGASVATAGPFDRGSVQFGQDLPPAVGRAAFLLGGQNALSDVLQAGDDFFVLRVIERKPERPLDFEEARAAVEARVRRAVAERELSARAAESLAAIRTSVEGGTGLWEAATGAGLKVDDFIGVIPARPSLPQDLSAAGRISVLLEPGQVSNFMETNFGGMAVGVAGRGLAPEDPSEEEIAEQLRASEGELLFLAWLDARRAQAGIVLPRRAR